MAEPVIIACPACASLNRVPQDKLTKGGKCGRCGAPLFDGKPVTLTSGNFDAHAARSGIPLLVDFWAAWCGPCRMVAPIVEEVASENAASLKVGKVNVDEESVLASRYGIRSIPTMLIFKNGEKVDQIIGYMDKNALTAKMKPYLAQ